MNKNNWSPPRFSNSGGTSVSSAELFFDSLERKLQHRVSIVIGLRKETISNVGIKAQKQESRAQGVHSNKVSRLCFKAEPGTLSHYMPSSCSRGRRYQVSLLPAAVEPPLRERIKENQAKLPGLGGCSNSGSTC